MNGSTTTAQSTHEYMYEQLTYTSLSLWNKTKTVVLPTKMAQPNSKRTAIRDQYKINAMNAASRDQLQESAWGNVPKKAKLNNDRPSSKKKALK